MKWRDRQRSRHIRDQRGQSRGSFGGRRSRPGIPIFIPSSSRRRTGSRAGLLGCGPIILILLFLVLSNGLSIFDTGVNNQPADQPQIQRESPSQRGDSSGQNRINLPELSPQKRGSGASGEMSTEDELYDFVSVVLKDTEELWGQVLAENGLDYDEPALVVFDGAIQSRCGYNSSAVGPFYCPADETIYIDLDFYNQLVQKYGGGGDFAMGYVVAHEVGHHLQNQLGVSDQVRAIQNQSNKKEQNAMTVRMELQADYLAGVWARYIAENGWLEEGDLEEGLNAAYHIGDDVLQKKAYGHVMPDSFTHGTAEQRQRWFMKGYEAGDLSQWDTYNIPYEEL